MWTNGPALLRIKVVGATIAVTNDKVLVSKEYKFHVKGFVESFGFVDGYFSEPSEADAFCPCQRVMCTSFSLSCSSDMLQGTTALCLPHIEQPCPRSVL